MKIEKRGQDAIVGALVADAAALGLHWIYDQQRIREIAPKTPEFLAPDASYLDGSSGYFAHDHKSAGDLSQYGHQLMVMLHSLAENQGNYVKTHYQRTYCEYFGYGGAYVGYIDHATRDTLNNVTRAEESAISRIKAMPYHGPDVVKHTFVTKLLSAAKQSQGAVLREQMEEVVRTTDDSDENVAYALRMVDVWEANIVLPGSNDVQLPATSKLAPLVACYTGNAKLLDVSESAIRVTNNSDTAVAFGVAVAEMIDAAIKTGDMEQVWLAGKKSKNPDVKRLLHEADEMSETTTNEATGYFGMSCNLAFGIPSLLHNASTAVSYEQAIRRNIYAGGDSCGRAVVLGAIAGACYGVGEEQGIPESWIDQLRVKDEVHSLIDRINT